MLQKITGIVVDEDEISPGQIDIEDGYISKFQRIKSSNLLYPSHYLIFPGFVDINAHCSDSESIGAAALSGGIVGLAISGNNLTTKERYNQAVSSFNSCIPVVHYGSVGLTDSVPPQFNDCFNINIPYRFDMVPPLVMLDNAELIKIISQFRETELTFYCDDSVVPRLMKIADSVHVRSKFANVVRSSSVLRSEVSPQYLFFDQGMLTKENRSFLHTMPPLLSKEDRLSLLEEVRNDNIDYLVSDHSSVTIADKRKGSVGVPNLDTFGAFVMWLIKEAKVDPRIVCRMACVSPGEWFNRYSGRKLGKIQAGYEASFTILDQFQPPIEKRPLYSRAKWSPFDLRLLPGSVHSVYLNGEQVVDGPYIKNV